MAKDEVVKFKAPRTLGACADRLYQLKQERLVKQKEVDDLKTEETALKEHIIQTLPKSEASGVAGRLARVTVVIKTVPRVTDWDAFYRYVKRTGSFELLQRRVTNTAVEERWEAGKAIPGVEQFKYPDVSINKV